ncbi:hypothetical protein ABFS83_03G098900 [Erythranthe nasuta]
MSSARRFISSLYSTYRMSRIISPKTKIGHLTNYAEMQNYDPNRRNLSGAPLPNSKPSSSSLSWLLGIALSIFLPFAGSKWGPLLQFKNDVDTAMETIEQIADVVEKVAEVVDEVADGISGNLPEGGRMKKVVEIVDDVAEETVKDAGTVGDAIDKFQEVEGKVENIVETLSEHHKEAKDA